MNMQSFLSALLLTSLVGCASTPNEDVSMEGDLSKTLPPSATGIPSAPLHFSSIEDAEKALAGYNYVLTKFADGNVQANVSGLIGSGIENPVEESQGASGMFTDKNSGIGLEENEMPFPTIYLKEKMNGQAAINALDDKLEEVAKAYDMSPERLDEILRTDATAWIDENGRLLYVDDLPKLPQGEGKEAIAPINGVVSSMAAATADPFSLHSKPGSNRIIYLDFNGHVATNTAWFSGTLNAQAYDIDGKPAAFSDIELNNIKEIWQRVAEDYAPFDVDVTTQEPTADALRRTSSSDMQYGSRAVITRSMPQLCSQLCGGVAYVNVFSYYSSTTPDKYQPAWAFFDKLGNGYPKYVAEAVAHEVGHNFNLNHDGNATTAYYAGHGSGATGWAPIMGVGYYKPVTQWSKGEYPGANNLQDDVAVIHAAGAPLRPDDYPNTTAAAIALGGTAASVTQAGVIERNIDVDMFAFNSGGGNAQFTVTPDKFSPNLDILLKVLDAQGNTVAQANPVDALSASLIVPLTSGNYFLHVEGVGKGDLITGYSDYGSLGQYQITGSYPLGNSSLSPSAAVISAFPTSGNAPLSVTFGGGKSSSAAAYGWNFGDGQSAAGNSSLSHVYNAAGNYTATLTVTDSSGLKSSTNQAIKVSQSPVPVAMKVSSTNLTRNVLTTSNSQCKANVTVNYGASPEASATVYGIWSGSATSGNTKVVFKTSSTAITSTAGVATLVSPMVPSNSRGTCAFTVTNVIKSGVNYDGNGSIAGSFTW
jgi:PKD repeat protein